MHQDPRVRADIAIVAASTQVFASPPGVATTFAREAECSVPEELADQRQALVALQRISGFMHALDDGWRTPAPEPEGQGPGAQMLAATIALEALLDGDDRERATTMARFALDGDRLLAVDDGLFWVNAAAVRTLADDDLGDFWIRARAAGHARGSLFATLSASLWEGFWQWRRGELHEALACLRDALEQDRMWGGTGVGEPFARGFQRVAGSTSRRWPTCWSPRAAARRLWLRSTRPPRGSPSSTPPGTPGAASGPPRCTGSGGPPRRGAWSRRRWRCCAGGVLRVT
jgi:hypothetical protein